MNDRERLITERVRKMDAFLDQKNVARPNPEWRCNKCGANRHHIADSFCSSCHTPWPKRQGLFRRRWRLLSGLTAIGIAVITGFVWFAMTISGGISEVENMGPWPDPGVAASIVLDVDPASLGFSSVATYRLSADDMPGSFEDAAGITFFQRGETAIVAWIANYPNGGASTGAFDSFASSASEQPVCRKSLTASFGSRGVFRCSMDEAHQRVYRSNRWVLVIFAPAGPGVSPEQEVLKVRDALSQHWKTITAS